MYLSLPATLLDICHLDTYGHLFRLLLKNLPNYIFILAIVIYVNIV